MLKRETMTLAALSALILLMGAGLLAYGVLAYNSIGLINQGLAADRQLLDKLNAGGVDCTGIDIGKYTEGTLKYHTGLKVSYQPLVNGYLLSGGVLLVLGSSQLLLIRKLRHVPTGEAT